MLLPMPRNLQFLFQVSMFFFRVQNVSLPGVLDPPQGGGMDPPTTKQGGMEDPPFKQLEPSGMPNRRRLSKASPFLAPRNLVSWENQGCRQMTLKPNPGETPIVRFIGVPPSVAANTFRIYLEIKSAALILDQVFGVPSVPSLEVYHIHPTSQSALLHKSMMFFWTSPGGMWTQSLQGKSDDPFWRWLILFSNQVIDKEVKLLMQCFFNEKIHRKNQS